MCNHCVRHAAASYGHLELLEYLISKGGDINIADEDGETPIFTVESVEVARWLVEHGANVDVQNNEGQSVSRDYSPLSISDRCNGDPSSYVLLLLVARRVPI
jgi:ankyrin repeat protein